MNSFVPVPPAQQFDTTTPMRCPVCGSGLIDVRIRDIGGITANMTWRVHAGYCVEHFWFQAEVISRPPREIFAVTRPFGAARRMVINGRETYSFATAWNDASTETQRSNVDPLDPDYWQISQSG